jgi:hypothetical protein
MSDKLGAQIAKLDGELQGLASQIEAKEAKWEAALENDKKALAEGLKESIATLNAEKKELIYERAELQRGLIPGKTKFARDDSFCM